MRTTRISLVAVVLLALSLVSCGSDTPAVCTSADNLSASIDDLKNVDVLAAGGVSDLQDKLTAVRDDLDQLKTDAKDEFATEISAVSAALDVLRTSIDAASADPSAANIAAVSVAASDVNGSVKTLVTRVKDTC